MPACDRNATPKDSMAAKIALITGITGQDGSFLAELLLATGYDVHGIIRRSSSFNTDRIEHLYHDRHVAGPPLFLHYGDLSDASSLRSIMLRVKPDEVYNLGAQSHVQVSFEQPAYTANVSALGTLRVLDAVRDGEQVLGKQIRFYQASSSEMYGRVCEVPQTETTAFHPRSPYACSKLYSFWQTVNYREAYDMHCSNGILFNHESERRGETFVTRKITRAATRIVFGLQERLYLGNLDAKRDWGYAKDYVEAMWRMLQQPTGDDYVVATNECHTVREFVDLAFREVGVTIAWQGSGVDERGVVAELQIKDGVPRDSVEVGHEIVSIDPSYFRPAEVDILQGNALKAETVLGWHPHVGFGELVARMVDHDFKLASRDYQIAAL
jgi:GDPmannose 4,6-dehydratase